MPYMGRKINRNLNDAVNGHSVKPRDREALLLIDASHHIAQHQPDNLGKPCSYYFLFLRFFLASFSITFNSP